MNRLRVYISSTFEDLKTYRAAVFEALERAGLEVARIEAYTAADERPVDRCLSDVARSDIYVGIYAWRYGYEPPPDHGNPDGKSITELEYLQAERANLLKLLFFAHPDTAEGWDPRFKDTTTGASGCGAKLNRLRQALGTENTASFFRTPPELATLVLAAIMRSRRSGRPYNIPPRPSGFIPRPFLTSTLINALVGADGIAGTNTVIHGAGGFGKSTLAIDICHQAEVVSAFPDGLLWLTLGETPDLEQVLQDFHVLATGQPPMLSGRKAIGEAIATALRDRRCLIVVDDVWRPEDLTPFLRADGPRLLVTTRLRTLIEELGQVSWREVLVGEMPLDEAIALLARGLATAVPASNAFERFALSLGSWPLLLELANARIREEYKGGRGSAATCVDRVAALFEKRGIFGFDRRSPSDRNAAVSNSVGVGIEFAEEALPGLGSKAAAISVFPENVAIPVQALSELLDMETFDVEEEVLRPLDGLSLLRWDRKHDTIHLHRMIHRALASRLAAVEGGPAAVHRRLLAAWGDSYRLPHEYAWRWFAWHCVLAHEEARLQQLLLDFHWLQTKLDVTDINALIADFAYVHDDHRIQVLERALRASAHILATRRGELATQLLARVIESDRPSLEELFCGLHAAARQPWLRPLTASLAQPGLLRVFHASSDIRAVAVNSDGRLIVSVGGDNTHTVWDSESAIPLRRVNLESGTVMALSFDANRSVEVTTLSDLATVTWDVQTGIRLKSDATLLPCLPSPLSVENDSEHVEWSHLSSDPAWVVITARGRSGKWRAANDYTIYLGSADHTVRVAGRFSDYNFHTAAIASKGRHLITSSFPSGTVVRDIETGVQVAVIPGDPVKAVACSVTGDVVVTVSYSGVITVWNLESLIASRRDVARHTRPVIDVRVANGEMLGFSVSVDGTANTWNLNTGAVVFAIAPEADTAFDPDWAIMSSAIDPDKRHVHFVVCDSDFIRTGEGTVESYDLTTGATVSAATRPWPFRETPIDLGALGINTSEKPLCISPDGTRGVTASADQTIWVWDIVTGTRIASFGVDSTPISCACIERATIVLMGEESGRVHVLRLEEAAS